MACCKALLVARVARRLLAVTGEPGKAPVVPTEPQAWRAPVESVAPMRYLSLVAGVARVLGGGGGGAGIPATLGGGGGGGGSSFTAPGAIDVAHDPGVNAANGFVTISW